MNYSKGIHEYFKAYGVSQETISSVRLTEVLLLPPVSSRQMHQLDVSWCRMMFLFGLDRASFLWWGLERSWMIWAQSAAMLKKKKLYDLLRAVWKIWRISPITRFGVILMLRPVGNRSRLLDLMSNLNSCIRSRRECGLNMNQSWQVRLCFQKSCNVANHNDSLQPVYIIYIYVCVGKSTASGICGNWQRISKPCDISKIMNMFEVGIVILHRVTKLTQVKLEPLGLFFWWPFWEAEAEVLLGWLKCAVYLYCRHRYVNFQSRNQKSVQICSHLRSETTERIKKPWSQDVCSRPQVMQKRTL